MLELRAICEPITNALYTAIKFYICSGHKDRSLFRIPLVDLNLITNHVNFPATLGDTNPFKEYLILIRIAVFEIVMDQSGGAMELQLHELRKWLNFISGENR
jgi:hypothetical protein